MLFALSIKATDNSQTPALRHLAFRKHGGLSGLLRLRNDVITGATRGGRGKPQRRSRPPSNGRRFRGLAPALGSLSRSPALPPRASTSCLQEGHAGAATPGPATPREWLSVRPSAGLDVASRPPWLRSRWTLGGRNLIVWWPPKRDLRRPRRRPRSPATTTTPACSAAWRRGGSRTLNSCTARWAATGRGGWDPDRPALPYPLAPDSLRIRWTQTVTEFSLGPGGLQRSLCCSVGRHGSDRVRHPRLLHSFATQCTLPLILLSAVVSVSRQ